MASTNYIVEDLGNNTARTTAFNAPAHINIQSFTDALRPAATDYPAGFSIWNTDDAAPNFSDGTNWRDAAGTLT